MIEVKKRKSLTSAVSFSIIRAMSTSETTTKRFLRSIPGGYEVHIEDICHTEVDPDEADYNLYYGIEITGERDQTAPVAFLRVRGASWVVFDLGEREIARGHDKIQLAHQLAEGSFDNDFRFEYYSNPEPSSNADLYVITTYSIPSQKVIDTFTSEDPGATIEAAREVQAIPLEERWAMYADRGL